MTWTCTNTNWSPLIALRCEQTDLYDFPMLSCQYTMRIFYFWASSSNHCLATLDLGASSEQLFDCLIVQNHQAVQSMRLMDWTLEDHMVDSLFFCATLTGHRGDHTPSVQTEADTSNTGAEAVSQTHAVLGRVIPSECRWWKSAVSCSVVCPLHIPLVIHPGGHMYVNGTAC